MMGSYGGGLGFGIWVVMGLFWIALIAVIIWLVVRLLPSGSRPAPPAEPPSAPVVPRLEGTDVRESPFDILDRRLAQGEIDLATYQAHRAALLAARGQGPTSQ